MSKDKKQNKATITMDFHDAMTLWIFLRDALEEDRRGKDSGRGGFIPMGDDFKLLRCLEGLAKGLDHAETMARRRDNRAKQGPSCDNTDSSNPGGGKLDLV